jgi:RimJ/RimL family protein N-acetyltransferase
MRIPLIIQSDSNLTSHPSFTIPREAWRLPSIETYRTCHRLQLISAIDEVCGERLWMRTKRFEITPEWEQALSTPQYDNHLLLVALDSQCLLGWCRLFPCEDEEDLELGIGLLARHRNQGLGKRMVRAGLSWAKEQGAQRVSLDTRIDNQRAIHVFEGCGFRKTGRRRGMWIEMMHELTHPRSRKAYHAK